jgi:pyridinium-3,5-biscarboxylic acid mononucleotide synthase
LRALLDDVKAGVLAPELAQDRLLQYLRQAPFEDLGFARVDHHRNVRQGFPEVVFGLGKTPQQIAAISERIVAAGHNLLVTRTTPEAHAAVNERVPGVSFHEEAAISAEIMGNSVDRLYDVGVAGLHRLLAEHARLAAAHVLIVVAGMEGALPSVVGGLVDAPVVAVPTSTGYGASFGGVTALLAMLNSCAAGVAVVNIDNGFGAAAVASAINHLP